MAFPDLGGTLWERSGREEGRLLFTYFVPIPSVTTADSLRLTRPLPRLRHRRNAFVIQGRDFKLALEREKTVFCSRHRFEIV